jgi:Ni/Co efflux regulator RcnB
MKTTLLIIAAVALGLTAPEAAAQQEKGESGKRPWKGGPPALRDMDQDMRERFRKASRAAMEDPEIQALKKKADDAAKAFREAMRKAVAEADPELAREVREKVGAWKQGKHMPKGLRNLPEEERDRLMAARKIAMQAPSVQDSKSALDAAGDGPEKREAAERYREVLREAILTADPSLKDTLENIGSGKRGEEESD